MDLYRLGDLLRWHIDRANVEPTVVEVDQQGESSSDKPSSLVGTDLENEEVDEPALKALVMSLMVTICPACGEAAELRGGV